VASQLALTLAATGGYAVGVLDVDLCGPSIPRMVLGNQCTTPTIAKAASGSWIPVYAPIKTNSTTAVNSLAVMSISFMLPDPNQAVVWRGPRKNALIQQFLSDVDWTGDTDGLDYLIVDTPPGTSDEHISTIQYLQKAAGTVSISAIVVTTPEEVSLADVRKELNFCVKTKVPVLGIIENMASYTTPLRSLRFFQSGPTVANGNSDGSHSIGEPVDCTSKVLAMIQEKCPEILDLNVSAPLFSNDDIVSGAQAMAQQYKVPYWGCLPLDPALLKACELGQCFAESFPEKEAARQLQHFVKRLTQALPVDMDTT
jgi:Mrp family chromosome partitioning ATPase